jgi:hypothetical protein
MKAAQELGVLHESAPPQDGTGCNAQLGDHARSVAEAAQCKCICTRCLSLLSAYAVGEPKFLRVCAQPALLTAQQRMQIC